VVGFAEITLVSAVPPSVPTVPSTVAVSSVATTSAGTIIVTVASSQSKGSAIPQTS